MRKKYKNTSLLIISLIAVITFSYGLDLYLRGLSNPYFMKVALSLSLFMALFYSIKNGLNDQSKIVAVTTLSLFAIAIFCAAEIRELYQSMILQMRDAEGMGDVVGQEYLDAMKNRVVGIGACFAIAIALTRVILFKPITKALSKTLIGTDISRLCPYCGTEKKDNFTV